MPKEALIPFLLFPIIGVAVIIVGINMIMRSSKIRRIGERTEGTIIRINSSRGSNGGYVYSPTIEYRTYEGVQTYTPVTKTNFGNYRVGDIVEIIYVPDNPKLVLINDNHSTKVLPLFFIVFGVFFITISSFVIGSFLLF